MSRFIIIVLIVMLLNAMYGCSIDEKESTAITTEETTKGDSYNAGYYQYKIDETMKEIVLYEAVFADCLTEAEKEYLEDR